MLGWFFHWAAQRGIRLAPGVVVSTGTTCVPKPIPIGRRIVGTFAGLGEVVFTISS